MVEEEEEEQQYQNRRKTRAEIQSHFREYRNHVIIATVAKSHKYHHNADFEDEELHYLLAGDSMHGGHRGPSFQSSDAAENRIDIGFTIANYCTRESSAAAAAAATLGVKYLAERRTRAQTTAALFPQGQVTLGFNKEATRTDIS
jgi:hypothetical protein